MENSKETLAQLSGAFKLAVAVYTEHLTTVQDAALHHKAACDKRHGELLQEVQTLLDQSHAMMGELESNIQEFLHSRKPRTKTTTKTTSRTRKAGRA